MLGETGLVSVGHIGPYPPPYGGVSVHVRRLHRRLLRAGVDSRVYCDPMWDGAPEAGVRPMKGMTGRPLCYLGWLSEAGLRVDTEIVHWHRDWHVFALTILFMLWKRIRVVITVHNQEDEAWWGRMLLPMRLASRMLAKDGRVLWIAVADRVGRQLMARGISRERIWIIPAYLPPAESANCNEIVPVGVREFISAHAPVLSVYGTRFQFDSDGTDVYGFDLSLEVVRRVKAEFDSVGLIVCVPRADDDAYLRVLESRIREYGIEKHVYVLTEPLEEAYPLWRLSDVYLRPTSTDGDAVAVREALSMRVPVVASDVCARPEGVVVFEHRNLDELVQKVREIVNHREEYVKSLSGVCMDDNFHRIVDVYRRAVGGSS